MSQFLVTAGIALDYIYREAVKEEMFRQVRDFFLPP